MSNYPKFKRGDKVETGAGTACTILGSTSSKDGKFSYVVEYDHNKGRAEIDEDSLKFRSDDYNDTDTKQDLGTHCPKCKKEWKKTHFGNKTWLDCLSCNDTAENLVKKKSNKGYKLPDWLLSDDTSNGSSDDLLEAFQRMIDSGVFYA